MSRSMQSMMAAAGAATLGLCHLGPAALAQTPAPAGNATTALPSIEVVAPRRAQPPRRPKVRVVTGIRRETPQAPPQTETQILAGKNEKLDEARQNIVAPIGANAYQVNHQSI
jgi:hypothetical protein